MFIPGYPAPDAPLAAHNQLVSLMGLDSTPIDSPRSLGFIHTFDNLAGWAIESTTLGAGAGAGQSGANSPVTAAEYDDGQSFVQLNGGGLDTIMRGWVSNIAGTFALQIPRTGLLDQVTPIGFAMKFQLPADSGSFVLGGFSDPTSAGTSSSPDGVYVGFLHSLSIPSFCGYQQTGGQFNSALSTVQLDGAWHIGYLWADGSGSYKFKIDNEAPIVIPNSLANFTGTLSCVRISFATTLPRVAWCTAIWPGVA